MPLIGRACTRRSRSTDRKRSGEELSTASSPSFRYAANGAGLRRRSRRYSCERVRARVRADLVGQAHLVRLARASAAWQRAMSARYCSRPRPQRNVTPLRVRSVPGGSAALSAGASARARARLASASSASARHPAHRRSQAPADACGERRGRPRRRGWRASSPHLGRRSCGRRASHSRPCTRSPGSRRSRRAGPRKPRRGLDPLRGKLAVEHVEHRPELDGRPSPRRIRTVSPPRHTRSRSDPGPSSCRGTSAARAASARRRCPARRRARRRRTAARTAARSTARPRSSA